MIFGASLYLWIIHHHNPKSPSKNWGTFVLRPSLFLSKSSNKMFTTTTKKSHRFSGKNKTRKQAEIPSPSTQKNAFLLLFSKKKKKVKYHWEYKTKEAKQSLLHVFHVFHLVLSGFFGGRSYFPLSSFGLFMPYRPSPGPRPGGIMSNKVRVVSTKASFFFMVY